MTGKDYELLAGVLNYQFWKEHKTATSLGWAIVNNLVRTLKDDNPKFDAKKFIAAISATKRKEDD